MGIVDLTGRYKGGVKLRPETAITRIALHHDAGVAPTVVSKVLPRFDAYDRQHDDVGGMPYHYSIDPWGTIYKCRLTTEITAHVRKNNTHSIAVMLMGYFHKDSNFAGQHPTPAQLQSMDEIVTKLAAAIPSIKNFTPHKKVPGSSTACPGNLWPYERVDALCARLHLGQG